MEEKGKEEEKDKEVEVTTVQREALSELAKFAEAHFALLIEQAERIHTFEFFLIFLVLLFYFILLL